MHRMNKGKPRFEIACAGHMAALFLLKYVDARRLLLSTTSTLLCLGMTSLASAAPLTPSAVYPKLVQEGLRLVGPSPGREDTVYAQALAVRRALARNDFTQANAILQRSLSQSGFHAGRYLPFSALMKEVTLPAGKGFDAHLNAWVKDSPDTAMPYLVRSVYAYNQGWQIRGHRFANMVLPEHMRIYQNDLRHAAIDAEYARRIDPENAYANYLPVWILSGRGDSAAVATAFTKAQARFPEYYALYYLRLRTLEPKWGGSVAAMYAFVEHYAGQAPINSALQLLYVQLFANLLNTAELECEKPDGNSPDACVDLKMQAMVTPQLTEQADAALHVYSHIKDKIDFSERLGKIIEGMSKEGGNVAGRYAEQFIQLTSNIMSSDEQLIAPNTAHNSFVMDRLTGTIWYRQSRFHEAEKLYRRAITDLNHTPFRSSGQKQMVRAGLYDHLAQLFYEQSDYPKAASYEIAADYMRGGTGASGYGSELCAALYHLHLYAQTVTTCQTRLRNGGSFDSLYWLARAYEALHQTQPALNAYRQLADSESHYRAYSAIQISVLYAEQHNLHKMLDTLNVYPWLYRESTDSNRGDIAAAYNNRCYAEMHLGHLHAALKNCTASLHYGNLPDAYAKEQDILQRLKAQGELPRKPGIMGTLDHDLHNFGF